MKGLFASLVMIGLLGLTSQQCQAGPLFNSQLNGGTNIIQDNDAEYISSGGSVLNVGSVLTSIVDFNSINGGPNLKTIFGSKYQLTAVAQIQVIGKTFIGIAPAGSLFPGSPATKLYDFNFAAVGGGTGTTITLYESPATAAGNLFQRGGGISIAQAVINAQQGTPIATFGFSTIGGVTDNFWTAHAAPDNFSIFQQTAAQFNGLAFTFGQDLLTNPGGMLISPDAINAQSPFGDSFVFSGIYDIAGTGQVFGVKNQNTHFGAYTSTQVSFGIVPEPASVSLMVVGILSVGCMLLLRGDAQPLEIVLVNRCLSELGR